MLITRGLEIKKYCLTKCLHQLRDFCVNYTSRVTILVKHVYRLIVLNLCSKNVQYFLHNS